MTREYIVRNRSIQIEEFEHVIAVMPERKFESSAETRRAFGSEIRQPLDGPDPTDWFAMEKAGWIFVAARPEVMAAVKSGKVVAGAKALQRVFFHVGGAMLLGSDRLCVRLDKDSPVDQMREELSSHGLVPLRPLGFARNLFTARVLPGRYDFLERSRMLSCSPGFDYVEPQFIEHIPGRGQFPPTGPEYAKQWHLKNTGQGGGTQYADVKAERAWQLTRGANARLAVIDSGFQTNHPSLADAVETTSGYFRFDGTNDPVFVRDWVGFPDKSHGTFCAGMAVARGGIDTGVWGVANQARLIAVACLSGDLTTQTTLARAIAYAADPSQEESSIPEGNGAHVISCSLGPSRETWDMTAVLQDAIDFAITEGRNSLGVPVFWAVNNNGGNVSHDEVCAYAKTIAVGSSTRIDNASSSIASGLALDFLATGDDVFSAKSKGKYGYGTGTSFAAPVAAGIAALVLSANPKLNWQEVRNIMRSTCEKIGGVYYGSGHNDQYGWGRLDAGEAVEAAEPGP